MADDPITTGAGRGTCADADPRLMLQTLRVAAVQNGRAELRLQRASACASCGARKRCATSVLADLSHNEPATLSLPFRDDLKSGDEVVVSLPGNTFLKAAALAYLVPPLALVLSTALLTGLGWPDATVALACIPVLALSLVPLIVAEWRGRTEAALRIEEVVPWVLRDQT
jgi:sigma-E factor negative regulatory protein RseC